MINIDELPCYYFAINDKAEIADCNETLAHDLHYDKSVLIGKSVEKIFPVATRIFFQTHFAPLIKLQGYSSEIFITLSTRDKKTVPVLCNAKTVIHDGESLIVFISMHVENRNKFEQALIEAKTVAEKALNENSELKISREKLRKNLQELDASVVKLNRQNEELKQFHHIISHELQEPLRKISVFSDLILKQTEQQKESPGDSVKKLAKASSRLRAVIEGLQDYVGLSNTRQPAKRISINNIITDITAQLKKKYPETFFSIMTDTIPDLMGQAEQLKKLFSEILDNSVQFKKTGVDPIIRINSHIISQNRFQSIADKYDYQEYLRIQVTDNGVGFKPEYGERILDLFKKLSNSENTGSGLAFSRKIMENHGGKISVEGVQGIGSTVTLLFPFEMIVE